MAKIIKELDLGGGVKIKVAIDEGKAVMVSNYGKEMLKIYYKTKEAGKKVSYNYRSNAMIELFDESIEEYSKNIDADYVKAMQKQRDVIKEIKDKQQEDKNGR